MYAMALIQPDPVWTWKSDAKVEAEDSRDHKIAVESRDAESTRLSVGDATART